MTLSPGLIFSEALNFVQNRCNRAVLQNVTLSKKLILAEEAESVKCYQSLNPN